MGNEENAAETMRAMGFGVDDITRALEQESFSFGRALLFLLTGLDERRTKFDTQERFRRHVLKNVKSVDSERLAGSAVFEQYRQRARDDCGIEVSVRDLGQYAGQTSGACFWLSIAASFAEADTDVLAQVLPADHRARQLQSQFRGHALTAGVAEGVRHSALGLCAEALRVHFCGGDSAVMLRADMKDRIFSAFAGLDARGPARTEAAYAKWVKKLATHEYADELVVLCVALEFRIRIVIVPHTPASALAPWAIATYGSTNIAPNGGTTIYLGNNDVHYVYLSQMRRRRRLKSS